MYRVAPYSQEKGLGIKSSNHRVARRGLGSELCDMMLE